MLLKTTTSAPERGSALRATLGARRMNNLGMLRTYVDNRERRTRRFWVPSPAVADDPSLAPMRRLATPRAGSKTAVPAVSTRPMMLVSAWSPATRARIASAAMYGDRRKKLTATSCWARRSEVGLASRVPVNRQITMMEAMASIPLSRPKPSSATDPAAMAAPIATPPSMPIQASVSQDNSRASDPLPALRGLECAGQDAVDVADGPFGHWLANVRLASGQFAVVAVLRPGKPQWPAGPGVTLGLACDGRGPSVPNVHESGLGQLDKRVPDGARFQSLELG
jgi:hypothetical protein